MNITRLRLHYFRRHDDLDIELTPGLNIVRGSNEAGKSTIQRALEMILFRRPTFAGAELDEIRPWRRPDADPTIEIEFDESGRRGTLRKIFGGHKGTVSMGYGDETLTDPAAVDAKVAQMTGLPSEKFLRATASIHHQELAGLTQDESTLRDRLQQSMSGADRGTHAARKKLEDAIRLYKTEGAKNPGHLKRLRSDVDRLSEELRSGETGLAQLEADRRALAETRAARARLDIQLAEQREGAGKAQRALSIVQRLAEASKRYAHYKRAAELREEIGKLEASHPSSMALPVLRTTIEHLRQLEFSLSEMRAELAAEPDLSRYDVAIQTPRWRPWLGLGAFLAVVAVLVLVGGVVAGAAIVGVLGGVAALVAAGGAFMAGARGRRQLDDLRLQNELRESEIARRLAGRTQLSERVRQTEQERAVALDSLGLRDLATAEKMMEAETEHVAQIGSRRAEYRGLMGDDPADEDVGQLRDRAAAEADECRHTLAGMGDIGREAERYLGIYSVAIQRLEPEREAAFEAEAQADARVMANDIDAEQVAATAEALDEAGDALAAAERRLRIYEDVLATLNAAERRTMKKAARFLEQRMSGDIERITGGRYRRLRVDEDTLTFSVYSPEVDDWVDVRRLSQGTLDQLYLCARLGIVRQVTQPAAPPLLFDDPFVTFDEQRAEEALKLLKDLAHDFQVIYLTCSDRYDAVADNVVVLPTPAGRDDLEPKPVQSADGESLSMWSSTSTPGVEPPAAPLTAGGTPPAANGNGSRNAPGEPPLAPLWPEER